MFVGEGDRENPLPLVGSGVRMKWGKGEVAYYYDGCHPRQQPANSGFGKGLISRCVRIAAKGG